MKISKKNLMAFVKNHAYGEEFNDFISIFFSVKRSKGDHLDMIDFFENDIIVDQIVINPSDCKTLVTMKYGIITEAFILYK